MGSWKSAVDTQQNSGDYIFRPADYQLESSDYSNFVWASYNEKQMDFTFNTGLSGENANQVNLHVSIDSDLNVLKFIVDLGSLPPITGDGHEITANFQLANFDNNMTFYTDSNELEM